MKPNKTNKRRKWLNKKLATFFLGAALAVAFFQWFIHLDYFYLSVVKMFRTEHQQIASQITSARTELKSIPNLVAERERQLVFAKELLASELNKVPTELNINNLIGAILAIADKCQVKALPLTTTPPDSQVVNSYSYDHWHIVMSVTGKLQNIVDFVDSLDGSDISNATVSSVAVKRADKNPGGAIVENDISQLTSTVELVIYTRSQDNKEKPK